MMLRWFSQSSQRLLITVALTVLFSDVQISHAQTFDCGSTGSDGALNVTTPGTYDFYPGNTQLFSSLVDPEGDNIYHFTTINIASGVTLRMTGRFLNGAVFLLTSGAVQIDGVIDLNGETGHPLTTFAAERLPSLPGAGGYGGGIGGNNVSQAQPGSGPKGGLSGQGRPGENATGGRFTGNAFLVPLIGGSGGGGGARGDSTWGSGGGAGGGAVLICSSSSIAIRGTISANGGRPGTGTNGFNGGGVGSGGAIRLVTPTLNGAGTLSVSSEELGARGRVRLEAFQNAFTGTIHPHPGPFPDVLALGSPFELFLPTTPAPAIRVVSVDGQPVPPNPTGSFTVPDVTINRAMAVTVNVEARNIPVGTIVKLYISSENAADQTVDSTPLAGTLESSNATASITLPSGFSRGFVRATWTNP